MGECPERKEYASRSWLNEAGHDKNLLCLEFRGADSSVMSKGMPFADNAYTQNRQKEGLRKNNRIRKNVYFKDKNGNVPNELLSMVDKS